MSAIRCSATAFQKSGSWCSACRVNTPSTATPGSKLRNPARSAVRLATPSASALARSAVTIAGDTSTAMTRPNRRAAASAN